MVDEEKAAWLSEYDGWKAEPPAGWISMGEIDLRAPVEYLMADGAQIRVPCVSNLDRVCMGYQPVAWRYQPNREGSR